MRERGLEGGGERAGGRGSEGGRAVERALQGGGGRSGGVRTALERWPARGREGARKNSAG